MMDSNDTMITNQDMQTLSRRELLKALAAGGGALAAAAFLPEKWSSPLVNAGVLPAHAQGTPNSPYVVTLQGFEMLPWTAPRIQDLYKAEISWTPCTDFKPEDYQITYGGQNGVLDGVVELLPNDTTPPWCGARVTFHTDSAPVGDMLTINVMFTHTCVRGFTESTAG